MQEQGTTGRGLKVAGIALIATGGLLYALLGGPDDDPTALIGAFVMVVGLLVHFRGRQHAGKARAAAVLQGPFPDSKPDVLYLRSFRADVSSTFKILQSGLTTEEEQLADVLRPFGNLIAIGRPGEPLPVPGAARMYASDSEWKSVVLDRMRSASLVVIRAGTGQGLVWEFGQAIRNLRPERLLIVVFDMKVNEYAAFVEQARANFGLSLPAIQPISPMRAVVDYRENPSKVQPGFITFSGNWNPELLPIPSTVIRLGYNDFRKSFNLALRPVFERNGVAWQPAGRFGE